MILWLTGLTLLGASGALAVSIIHDTINDNLPAIVAALKGA